MANFAGIMSKGYQLTIDAFAEMTKTIAFNKWLTLRWNGSFDEIISTVIS